MIGFKRTYDKDGNYVCEYIKVPLSEVANAEKTVPLEWINKEGTGLTQAYIDYALPLIQGDMKAPLEDGLPRFAHLKKVLAKK